MVFHAATPTGPASSTPRAHARCSLPPLPPPRAAQGARGKAKEEDAARVPVPPREVGTNNKRSCAASAAPHAYPPRKRTQVSATRTFPPGCGRGADHGSSLLVAAPRPDGASAAAPPPPPPLSVRKAASGVSSKASAALVSRPIAGTSRQGPPDAAARVLTMTSSGPPRPSGSGVAAADASASKAVAGSGGGSGRRGKDLLARSLPKPTMVSAIRRFPPGCGRVRTPGGQSLKSAANKWCPPTVTQSDEPSAPGGSFVGLNKKMIVKQQDRASQSLMSADECATESSTSRGGSFSLKKKVTVKDPALLRLKVASACTMGSISKPADVVDIILKADGFLKALDAYDRELQSNLYTSSDVPSVRRQSQDGTQNADSRSKVRMLCGRFRFICKTAVQFVEQHSLKISRIDLVAAKVMKELPGPGYTQHGPIVGNIPGVEIGDEFLYRVELALVGLHRPRQAGIDTTRDENRVLIATSIVASGGYPDELSSSGELIYTGSGGKLAGKKKDENQKLKRGNLALRNCIRTKTPVRVIHGFKGLSREEGGHSKAKGASAFTYDGLYHVVDYWKEGQEGSKVFKYKLQRIPGQPEVPAGRPYSKSAHKKTEIVC